jgi:flagellin FlaB
MLLVAGMAASVVVQTVNMMNQQALDTGRETIDAISNGIEVTKLSGHVDGDNITQIAIFVSPIAGSNDIDLRQSYLSLSDTDKTMILYYDDSYYEDNPSNGLFGSLDITGLGSTSFGIIEIRDIDNSSNAASPIINRQDIVVLMINASTSFGDGSPLSGIEPRTEISGGLYPESGIKGVIQCMTPAAYVNSVIDLQ